MFQLTPVVRNLLILNIVFFIVDAYILPLTPSFALYSFMSPSFLPFQFVTYMFLHANIGHIFSNMFGLIIFGPMLERIWGPKRFLIFYFVTGIGAGLLFAGIDLFETSQLQQAASIYLEYPTPEGLVDFMSQHAEPWYKSKLDLINNFEASPRNPRIIQESVIFVKGLLQYKVSIPMVGASGAIFGILMAFGLLFPNTELFLLFIPFPIKAKYFVAFYGMYELYSGIQNAQSDNVAHFAHLGGMLFAFIMLKIWGSENNKFY
ncbi:rhomboid family intramembrane serine protease [Persicitalea sp.]|uniref:rhomboid family intramembrane serine protease n=1 Tax=Persicitalea sp. TaxID=3100273 RepID=UPI00359454A0